MIFWGILYGLIWIWQFPQNCLGLILGIGKKPHIGPGGFKFYLTKWWIPCIVLGQFIFIGDPKLVRFSYGKSVLSVICGPLFLLIVSIPSFLLMAFSSEYYYFLYWATKCSLKLGKKNYKNSRH